MITLNPQIVADFVEPATESLKKTVLPWLVQLISSADHGYDAPFIAHALKTLAKLLNKDRMRLE